jgi:hypothetical protein
VLVISEDCANDADARPEQAPSSTTIRVSVDIPIIFFGSQRFVQLDLARTDSTGFLEEIPSLMVSACYTSATLEYQKEQRMASRAISDWLPRVLFESVLIVVSILLALYLDEWRDDRQDAENIENALANFVSEIQQNRARVEDAAPFNQGLRHVLSRRQEVRAIESVATFINIFESYNPVALQSTAWETAIATGALAKMDYKLVSALSQTYSLQNRYQQISRNGMAQLTSPQNLSEEKLDLAVYNAIRYLDDVTGMETELGGFYAEAESVILSAKQVVNIASPADPEPVVQDRAKP